MAIEITAQRGITAEGLAGTIKSLETDLYRCLVPEVVVYAVHGQNNGNFTASSGMPDHSVLVCGNEHTIKFGMGAVIEFVVRYHGTSIERQDAIIGAVSDVAAKYGFIPDDLYVLYEPRNPEHVVTEITQDFETEA